MYIHPAENNNNRFNSNAILNSLSLSLSLYLYLQYQSKLLGSLVDLKSFRTKIHELNFVWSNSCEPPEAATNNQQPTRNHHWPAILASSGCGWLPTASSGSSIISMEKFVQFFSYFRKSSFRCNWLKLQIEFIHTFLYLNYTALLRNSNCSVTFTVNTHTHTHTAQAHAHSWLFVRIVCCSFMRFIHLE